MNTGIVINPHSMPKEEGEKLVHSLEHQIKKIIDTDISVYHGAEEIDEIPDQIVLYGGDGSVMMTYNQILSKVERTPPILVAGGGSGTYWLHNLRTNGMSLQERLELLSTGTTKSFGIIKVEYDGTLSPHAIGYADSFGIGSAAQLTFDAETMKARWKSSSRKSSLARSSLILLSYMLAGARQFTRRRHYEITGSQELASMHGSTLQKVGLGVNLYRPENGFSVVSTKANPIAGFMSVLQTTGQVIGLRSEEVKQEIELVVKGKVPMHFNGSPFEYSGGTLKLTYEPDKLVFTCPAD